MPLSLPVGQIGTEFVFASAHDNHETNSVTRRHGPAPAVASHITPDRPGRRHGTARRIAALRGIQKELYSLFREENLRDLFSVFILKHPGASRPQICELH